MQRTRQPTYSRTIITEGMEEREKGREGEKEKGREGGRNEGKEVM